VKRAHLEYLVAGAFSALVWAAGAYAVWSRLT
jgi:hypothetical protein